MSTTDEAVITHKHGFPCNPPGGTFWAPGPCECGKTYDQNSADRMLAEALEAIAAAYGVPPRVYEYWAVAFGSDDVNDGTGQIFEYDDEDDARDHLQFIGGASVVKRTVIALRWETVPDRAQQREETVPGCGWCRDPGCPWLAPSSAGPFSFSTPARPLRKLVPLPARADLLAALEEHICRESGYDGQANRVYALLEGRQGDNDD